MSLRRISGPATLPVTAAEAKANGRIDHDAEDALIEGLIGAALAHVEKSCGVAFEAQTWEVVLDAFPTGEIELPFGPVASVTSVSYVDSAGDDATVSADDYAVDTASPVGWVIPVDGWPTAMAVANAVRVGFVAGAGTPADVRQAILLIVEHWYENRAASSADSLAPIPFGAEAIISLHRKIYC